MANWKNAAATYTAAASVERLQGASAIRMSPAASTAQQACACNTPRRRGLLQTASMPLATMVLAACRGSCQPWCCLLLGCSCGPCRRSDTTCGVSVWHCAVPMTARCCAVGVLVQACRVAGPFTPGAGGNSPDSHTSKDQSTTLIVSRSGSYIPATDSVRITC